MAQLQPDTAPDVALLTNATGMLQNDQTAFMPAMQSRLAALRNTGADRGYMTSKASADTAQQMGTPGYTGMGRSPAFAGALRRGQALAKVTSFGDTAIATQNMNDRIAALRVGRGIRSGAFTGMSAASTNALGIQTAQAAADAAHRNVNMNVLGSAAGAGIAGVARAYNQPSPPTDWTLTDSANSSIGQDVLNLTPQPDNTISPYGYGTTNWLNAVTPGAMQATPGPQAPSNWWGNGASVGGGGG